MDHLSVLDKKARFARVRALRGWGLAYQASSIDLPHQSHTLDPALKASRARRTPAIQLLVNDITAKAKLVRIPGLGQVCDHQVVWMLLLERLISEYD